MSNDCTVRGTCPGVGIIKVSFLFYCAVEPRVSTVVPIDNSFVSPESAALT